MEAPDKIYINIDPVWGSMCVNYNKYDTNNIEYFRKNAIIDEVVKWMQENLTYTHPRKETVECIVNITKFKEDMGYTLY